MVSDFFTVDWGPLHDDNRCIFICFLLSYVCSLLHSEVWIVFQTGRNRDGWFTAKHLLAQVDNAIDISKGHTKGYVQGLFPFDNAPSHQKHADNALSACLMVRGAPFFIF